MQADDHAGVPAACAEPSDAVHPCRHIAVAGIGAIGSIVGGCLALAGQDVTLVCTSWRENAEFMKAHGLTVVGEDGVERTTQVKALFIDELERLSPRIDLLLISTKSNDTERCLLALRPYVADDGVVVSLQNGMNEEIIVPLVGEGRVVACVCYTGGALVRPGHVWTHGGHLVVGELDGSVTPRVREIAGILSLVTTTRISKDVLRERWDKLAQVTMTVPVGAVAGVGFPAILRLDEAHVAMARLMCETLAVADAAGFSLDSVIGLSREDWRRLADGPAPELSRIIRAPFELGPGVPEPDPDEAPLLKDLRRGLPLEIEYTNGYVIRRGRELGVPTPTHDSVMTLLRALQRGEKQPGLERLGEI